MLTRVSSSDGVLISTSLRRADRKDGWASEGAASARCEEPAKFFPAVDDSPLVWLCGGSRRVRGRFSFLSGSWWCSSCGSAEAERDRFLDSHSLAFSKADHANCSLRDSCVSCGCGGSGRANWGRLLLNTSRAPKRLAMFKRCSQRSCSLRSCSRSWRDRRRPSKTSGSSSW